MSTGKISSAAGTLSLDMCNKLIILEIHLLVENDNGIKSFIKSLIDVSKLKFAYLITHCNFSRGVL